ncbi:hypothetical protein [Brevibacillus centrosporus]|uniref:hypothetical protein n=1 Tax=Brevibacillus centrosporus TaxID=54910 RepID=UPI003987F456
MSSTTYLIIGIVLALAGFGMLFAAMASSPILKKIGWSAARRQPKITALRKAEENGGSV